MSLKSLRASPPALHAKDDPAGAQRPLREVSHNLTNFSRMLRHAPSHLQQRPSIAFF
jgi:hypothetical protein